MEPVSSGSQRVGASEAGVGGPSGALAETSAGVGEAADSRAGRVGHPPATGRCRRRQWHRFRFAAAALGLLLVFGVRATHAAGTVTGTVFQDYNADGTYNTSYSDALPAIDEGVSGVTVTAFDTTGSCGSTASGSDGTYSLVHTCGTATVRVEFSNLPAGFQPSSVGTDSGTSVQFVGENDTGVDFAINVPDEYSQNNPWVAVPLHVFGDNDDDTLRIFRYGWSTERDGNINGSISSAGVYTPSPPDPLEVAFNDEIGTVYGVAWDRHSDTLYASAYLKRHARFGGLTGTACDDSTGAIYAITDPAGTPSVSCYVDLNNVFGAGTAGVNPHPYATTDWYTGSGDGSWVDTATRTEIGKRSLGDLELSLDGSRLYVVNLADRRLYEIPTSGALNSSTINSYAIPDTGLTAGDGNACPSADVRPFALGVDRSGELYVGAVCSGESGGANDLAAYVWRFNTTTGAFTLVLNGVGTSGYIDLGYVRDDGAEDWHEWDDGSGTDGNKRYTQPMLTDIVFDGDDMVLGFRDRHGDQVPPDNQHPEDGNFYTGIGDTLRACWTGTDWALEYNRTCGSTTTGDGDNSELPKLNSDGPGDIDGGDGGEFYFQEFAGDSQGHDEASHGGLLQVPGFDHVVTTGYDTVAWYTTTAPLHTESNGNFPAGGVARYQNRDGTNADFGAGQTTGAYDVYRETDADRAHRFAKANGLGDIEALLDPAPIEIGNRLWDDTDRDGIQDPGEAVFANVTLYLYTDPDGTPNSGDEVLVATTTSSVAGEYYFRADGAAGQAWVTAGDAVQSETHYLIVVDPNDPNLNRAPITANADGHTDNDAITDVRDSDAESLAANGGSLTGKIGIALTTGPAGSTNHGLDFGFGLTADLQIVKTASPQPVSTGENLTYTLTVTNNGPTAAPDVVVTDTLLPGVTWVSTTPSQGSCSAPSGVTCELGTIDNGNSATVTIVVTVD